MSIFGGYIILEFKNKIIGNVHINNTWKITNWELQIEGQTIQFKKEEKRQHQNVHKIVQ